MGEILEWKLELFLICTIKAVFNMLVRFFGRTYIQSVPSLQTPAVCAQLSMVEN